LLALSSDVKDEKSIENLIAELRKHNVQVDVLSNNTGTSNSWSSIKDSGPTTWWGDYV
jgi:NADP-dependent 3-hydroxy acid dehydrogenase YdfG